MVKKHFPKAFGVFINTSLETIKRRLESRHSHTEEQINERLENARKGFTHLKEYDLVVINEDRLVEDVVNEIMAGFREHNLRLKAESSIR
jgi:guanylate kinase